MYNNFKKSKINKKSNYCNLFIKRFTNNIDIIFISIRTLMCIF